MGASVAIGGIVLGILICALGIATVIVLQQCISRKARSEVISAVIPAELAVEPVYEEVTEQKHSPNDGGKGVTLQENVAYQSII